MSAFDRLRAKLIPTSDALLQVAQKNLLKALAGNVVFKCKTSRNGLNYAVFERATGHTSGTATGTLVLMHGYGSGLGFFFKNYFGLLGSFNKIVAVDWAGMGGSSRALTEDTKSPRLSWLSLAYSTFTGNQQLIDDMSVPRSINFFTESLKVTLDEVLGEGHKPYTLAGHSLGGYLVTHYARKYHEEVDSLILISPAGVCEIPEAAKRNEAKASEVGWGLRALRTFWSLNMTPQDVVRLSGSYGPTIIKNSLGRRFRGAFDDENLRLVADYLYHISAAQASGEFALNSLLLPFAYLQPGDPSSSDGRSGSGSRHGTQLRAGVFAKKPLEEEMRHHPFATWKKPVLITYGDNDWLRFDGVEGVVQKWNDDFGIPTTLAIIENAGHHLYLDNHERFHSSIEGWRGKHNI
jgi:cardiolipin-specific phospholipase